MRKRAEEKRLFGITGVVIITVICLPVSQCVTVSPLNSTYNPIICGVAGGILGVAAMFIMPDFPATDHITAAAVGIVSGLAATGANQVLKQLGSDSK